MLKIDYKKIKTHHKKEKLLNIMNLPCSKELHSKQSKDHDEKKE